MTRTRIRIGKELLPKNGDISINNVYQKAVHALKKHPKIIESNYDREDYGGKDRFYFYKFKLQEIGDFTAFENQFENTLEHLKNIQYEQLTAEMSEVDDEIFEILSKHEIIRSYKPSFDETLDKIIVQGMQKKVDE